MNNPPLTLIVLRTSHIKASLLFYQTLGFTFTEERHGTGPVHYSTETGSVVLEIYPGEEAERFNWKASGATMLGFNVRGLDGILSGLENTNAEFIANAKETPRGRRAMVVDPDGRLVELLEPKKV
jgi:lactoylglutathione lyase